MTRFFTPLTSGTDDYANELAHEWNEDIDDVPIHALPTIVTRASLAVAEATLEVTATLARTCVAASDDGAASAGGLLPHWDEAAVLKWRG